MQLIHDRAEGYFFVRAVKPDAIVIIDRELQSSFLLAPDQVVEGWPVSTIDELGEDAVLAILETGPEVVILGSGNRQRFPDRKALLPLMREGIGVEVMDNAAAARTYNLLAAEGRRVLAAFILDSAQAD
ncbi:Mth938-like domain-containing protein [Dokdonella sp.]|uniref:Mth938-like domain-containing protein n=1 Tax=Dokdonella sp. TaxID=2291710 RepID=UPI003C63B645